MCPNQSKSRTYINRIVPIADYFTSHTKNSLTHSTKMYGKVKGTLKMVRAILNITITCYAEHVKLALNWEEKERWKPMKM